MRCSAKPPSPSGTMTGAEPDSRLGGAMMAPGGTESAGGGSGSVVPSCHAWGMRTSRAGAGVVAERMARSVEGAARAGTAEERDGAGLGGRAGDGIGAGDGNGDGIGAGVSDGDGATTATSSGLSSTWGAGRASG